MALPYEATSSKKALKYGTRCQGIIQFYSPPTRFTDEWNEPYLPLPFLPKLVLIYRPRRGECPKSSCVGKVCRVVRANVRPLSVDPTRRPPTATKAAQEAAKTRRAGVGKEEARGGSLGGVDRTTCSCGEGQLRSSRRKL